MKTIKSALICLLALAAVTVSAHPPRHGERPRQQREQLTPEQRAKQKSEQLTKELGLNKTQRKQVYESHLAMSKNRLAAQESQQRKREEMRAKHEKMRAEREKSREVQCVEMKKILTPEQFAKWEKMKAERGAMRGGGKSEKDGTIGRGENGGKGGKGHGQPHQ